jgi:transcriptional regulator with XRE-family HTH domain
MARTQNASDLWGRAVSVVTRRFRMEAKLSYKQFEEVTGIDRNQVWFLEHNEVKVRLETLERLAGAFGMTATEFLAHVETELAVIRKQDPDPFLAAVTGRKPARVKRKRPAK